MDALKRRYTAIIVYSPSVGTDKVELEIDKFTRLVKESDGKVERIEYLGLKQLAYEIRKCKSGHYVQCYFNLNRDKNLKHNLSEINRKISPTLNLTTIRHMIMHIEHEDFNFETLKNFEQFTNEMKI